MRSVSVINQSIYLCILRALQNAARGGFQFKLPSHAPLTAIRGSADASFIYLSPKAMSKAIHLHDRFICYG